jgi:acyl dehydratase
VRVFGDVSELAKAVGEHLGYSGWLPVTQERVDQFADATGDHQWIHVDPERAKTGPFGGTIAHGYLTLSLIPGLMADVYRVEGVAMGINYGTDKVRFPAPLPVGGSVRAGAELVSVRETAQGFQAVVRMTVEAAGIAKPVCVADTVVLLVPAKV